NTAQPSFTPPVDPGKVITKVEPATPAIHLDKAALGSFANPLFQNATAIPGISLSRCFLIASTVRSSGLITVPPQVSNTSGASSERKACSTAGNMSASATTIGSGVLSP